MSDDLRIDRVETVLLDIPLRRPHRFARVSMDAQPVLYVLVRTAGGVTGTGEGVVPAGPWWGGESVETMQVIIERYAAPVLGRRVDDVARLLRDVADVVAAPLRYADGHLHLPESPGLGVELDPDKIRAFRRD